MLDINEIKMDGERNEKKETIMMIEGEKLTLDSLMAVVEETGR